MKKLLCILLSLVMLVGLCACSMESEADLILKVAGSWSIKTEEQEETYDNLMEAIEWYDEEIAAVETTLYTVKTVTFNTDKTYSFEEKAEDVKACLVEFFEGAFADLYKNRGTLAECYDTDISQLSEADFYQFYANLYSKADIDTLIEDWSNDLYDYETFVPFDEGTYTIKGDRITLTPNNLLENKEGYVTYKVDGNSMTLTWSDSVEVYTKIG